MAALPGVEAVTLADSAPLAGFGRESVQAEGGTVAKNDAGAATPYVVVDDHYFSAIGMSVINGRAFDRAIESAAPKSW